MLIAEFARLAGVSPRALRHYEQQGLLAPRRTSAGYRAYEEADLATVERIRLMIEAGLTTLVIGTYLDCMRRGEDGHELDMCPDLRRELERVEERLDAQSAQIEKTRRALCALS